MNIWVAFMNLENMYGSNESLQAVFERAVQNVEAIDAYNQLINIYMASEKHEVSKLLGDQYIQQTLNSLREILLNPSNAKATFIHIARMQRFF